MEKEKEKEKNFIVMVNYGLKGNILVIKNGKEKAMIRLVLFHMK